MLEEVTHSADEEEALLAKQAREALDDQLKAEMAYEAAAHDITVIWTRRPIGSAELERLRGIAKLDTARVRFERGIKVVDNIVHRYGGDPIYEKLPIGSQFAVIEDIDDGELPF